jgi:hypothetical protein
MKRKEVFILALTIFLTVIAWVVSDIVHARDIEHAKLDISVPTEKAYNIDESIFTILEPRTE